MNEALANYFRQMPIDIFTDTSTKEFIKPNGKILVTSYGFVALFGFIPFQTSIKVSIASGVPTGEAKAIDDAVNWLKWYSNRIMFKPAIRIFSDSLPSLQALNNILNYYSLRRNGNGKIELPVDMRSSFNMAITVAALNLLNSGFTFQTYYVPGHMDVYDKNRFNRDYRKYIDKFIEHNSKLQYAHNARELASYELLYYAGSNNNHIDIITRNYLFQYKSFIEHDINVLHNNNVFTRIDQGYLCSKEPIHWPINNPLFAQPIQMLQPMMLT